MGKDWPKGKSGEDVVVVVYPVYGGQLITPPTTRFYAELGIKIGLQKGAKPSCVIRLLKKGKGNVT